MDTQHKGNLETLPLCTKHQWLYHLDAAQDAYTLDCVTPGLGQLLITIFLHSQTVHKSWNILWAFLMRIHAIGMFWYTAKPERAVSAISVLPQGD